MSQVYQDWSSLRSARQFNINKPAPQWETRFVRLSARPDRARPYGVSGSPCYVWSLTKLVSSFCLPWKTNWIYLISVCKYIVKTTSNLKLLQMVVKFVAVVVLVHSASVRLRKSLMMWSCCITTLVNVTYSTVKCSFELAISIAKYRTRNSVKFSASDTTLK